MTLPPDGAPANQLHDALAHSEANRAAAVKEALQHGTEHLKAREQQRQQASAARLTGANQNSTGG